MRTAEVAGTAARELSDEEVLAVLTKEAKKRREAAEAFAEAGRAELAEKERAEEEVLAATCRPSSATRSWPTWSPGCWPRAASAAVARWGRP